ncbi:hypothetical protein NE237_032660 [Protea cynaroides]|uniref:RNase H type-1 domain-containing protein n=1 Tax=Protea cynaroides TaxID=273540 RepID=A0A9Q0R3A5_9MAGN|nr:hypothetical protein NE237_032660 [Protea cynaroides]
MEYHAVHSSRVVSSMMGDQTSLRPSRWLPPMAGYIKINVDAAVKKDLTAQGIGFIIKNADGANLLAVLQRADFPSVVAGEALAIRQGLKEAISMGFQSIVMESDCLEVVQLINGVQSDGEIFVASIVEDIKVLMSSVDFISCSSQGR